MKRQTIVLMVGGLLLFSGCAQPDSGQQAAESQTKTTQAGEKSPNRIATGDKAPPFRLVDQHGQEQSLDGLLERGNVALVFYRSADW